MDYINMNVNIFVLLIVWILTSVDTYSNGETDYCIDEPFIAKCSANEVITISSATYGFMGIGRCAKFDFGDFGINCSIDVKTHLDAACSMKNECRLRLGDLDNVDDCLTKVRPYLLATFECLTVETGGERCMSSARLSGRSGHIASSVAKSTGCGSLSAPWEIPALNAQTISVYMSRFSPMGLDDTTCSPVGFIFNAVTKDNVTICDSAKPNELLYSSSGESLKLQIIGERDYNDFILDFKVLGCADLVPPDFAWYQRSEDDAVIGCQYRNMTWSLHCDGDRWNGVVGRCNDTERKAIVTDIQVNEQNGHRLLILVCISALVLLVIIICVTVGILKLIDRSKQKQSTQQQLLMEHTLSRGYSGAGQQHNMQQQQPMYNERIEMVPDILESSLPRPQRTLVYGPESESSYGTNYPGTMYYMGPQNYSNVPPQRRTDYDTVTLPKKPETVSDSESDDLYATIPPY